MRTLRLTGEVGWSSARPRETPAGATIDTVDRSFRLDHRHPTICLNKHCRQPAPGASCDDRYNRRAAMSRARHTFGRVPLAAIGVIALLLAATPALARSGV